MAAVLLLKPEVVIYQLWIEIPHRNLVREQNFNLLKRMQSLALNTEVAFGLYSRHIEKSILRHNSCGDRLTETKFSMLVHNHMPMTTPRPKFKQEIEF